MLYERLGFGWFVGLLNNLEILDVVDFENDNWVLLFRRVHLVDASSSSFRTIAPYILEFHRPLSLVDLNERSLVPDLSIRDKLEQGANQLVLLLGWLLSFCLVRSFRHLKLIINNINQPKNIEDVLHDHVSEFVSNLAQNGHRGVHRYPYLFAHVAL